MANSATFTFETLRRTRLCDAPNDVRVFLLRDQRPRKHTLLSKWYPRPNRRNIRPISLQNGKIYALEMLENNTLWGGTYLYGLYMRVPSSPPPPPPGLRLQRPKEGGSALGRVINYGFRLHLIRQTMDGPSLDFIYIFFALVCFQVFFSGLKMN